MNELIGRLTMGLALMLLVLALMLAGLAFLLMAVLLVAAKFLGPVAATAVTGFTAFAVARILLLIARYSGTKRRPLTRRSTLAVADDGAVDAAALSAVLAGEGRRLLAGHAKGATVAALALGVAVGVSPRLRRTMWRLLN